MQATNTKHVLKEDLQAKYSSEHHSKTYLP